ncbi:hypothetical protein SprV_0100282600 [Sparganum proliferum]
MDLFSWRGSGTRARTAIWFVTKSANRRLVVCEPSVASTHSSILLINRTLWAAAYFGLETVLTPTISSGLQCIPRCP